MGYGKKLKIQEGAILAMALTVRGKALTAFARALSYEPGIGGAYLVEVFADTAPDFTDYRAVVAQGTRLFPPCFVAMVFLGGHKPWTVVDKGEGFDKQATDYAAIEIAFDRSLPPAIWNQGKTRDVRDRKELQGLETSVIWNPLQIEQRILAVLDPASAPDWIRQRGKP